MPEKELNEYMITLEKEGPTPPPSIPPWFKPYGEIIEKMAQFMIDQLKFNKNILKRLDKVDQRLDKLESRIDNLVKKNKLKE